MLRIIFCTSLILFIGCKQNDRSSYEQHDENISQSISPMDLIGKTIEYRYGESIYHVHIDSEFEMHWEAMAGDEKGITEEETYKIESVGENLLFITWGEANGIGVSQILDFNKGIVYNHLLRGRDINIGRGEIRILEE